MLGCMYRALCVVGFRLASATKPRQPVDNRKKGRQYAEEDMARGGSSARRSYRIPRY